MLNTQMHAFSDLPEAFQGNGRPVSCYWLMLFLGFIALV